MKTIFTIIGSIFGLLAVASFNFHYIYPASFFVAIALLSYAGALFSHFRKRKRLKTERMKDMDIIGKKTVLKIGGKLPKDNENEIIGESTIVHVPESEIGRHKRIIGTESKVIIGDDDKKDK